MLLLATMAIALPCLGQSVRPLPAAAFAYDARLPLDIQISSVEKRDGVEIRDVTYRSLTGGRTAAYLVGPPDGRKCAGVLFVHWYAEKPDSNRTQFLSQAIELAPKGVRSLLIETMWSPANWFEHRNPADDYDNSIQQVKDLRRALDVLAAQPGVDPRRIAYVGHDFGAMYGTVLAGVEARRVCAWAFQAGTSSFSTWYLLGRKLSPDERQAVVNKLAPLDPVLYIGAAASSPVLFQFARGDFFVTKNAANALFAAAREPKSVLWYDTDHSMKGKAVADRQQWLTEKLHPR